jgi:hypothetical protein
MTKVQPIIKKHTEREREWEEDEFDNEEGYYATLTETPTK